MPKKRCKAKEIVSKLRHVDVLVAHESLAIRVRRKLKSVDVIDVFSELFVLRGVPGHIRSDNVLRQEHLHSERQQISSH